ncbi:hypothetical protein [Leptothrix discophora]|uniref:Uncharacterized protein n=1 Tax=Leptothrix discophora TaxID=89 RepID=A0ABT9G2G7_LEPDI|nr:hypothetical protein [Leptothrix discophora]MDP4300363.1 hypothetical protein [Leptothrix discophora]
MPMPESLNDALVEAVKAVGGSKAAGLALWPAKGMEAAQRHLLACLNPDRPEKLSPDEALHIERLARQRGCHVVAQYRAAELGYAPPVPIDPEDERAQLQREYVEAAREMSRMAQRIEALAHGSHQRGRSDA